MRDTTVSATTGNVIEATDLRRVYRPWPFFGLALALTWVSLWTLVAGQRLGWFEKSFALTALAGANPTLSALLFVHATGVRGFARDFQVEGLAQDVRPRQ